MFPIVVSILLLGLVNISYETECSDGATCYHNGTEFGVSCCHYKDGVCCSDGQLCCPQNSECKQERGICISKNHLGIPKFRNLVSMVPTSDPQIRARFVACSKTLSCPGDSKCCPVPFMGNDCCPISNGVCCGDFRHCCPFETHCDLKARNCIVPGNFTRIPWYKKTKATPQIEQNVDNIKCLDNKTICYDTDTCCPIGSGIYGCCPLPNAVCCPDQRHCCPTGLRCDPQTGSCNRVEDNVSMICPGGQYSCPDRMTCCVVSGQKYGCCPFPNAVCCKDDKHCCPNGSVCDLAHDRCIQGDRFVQIAKKQNAKKVTDKTNAQPYNKQLCPNNQTCPDQYTCCQLPSSAYGCCPYWNAVCCNDHVHCCPQATVCDLSSRGCRQGNEITLLPLNEINPIITNNETEASPID